MSFAFYYNQEQQAPFALYIAHENKSRGGTSWKPSAMLCVTPGLQTSGFLACLGAEEFKNLLLLLSFFASDGRCAASTVQLAQSLGTSQRHARARFERLAAVRWQGRTIVLHSDWGGGLEGFAPTPGFIPVIEEPQGTLEGTTLHVVPREVLIAHSRCTYARPREEVERDIAQMMDWNIEKAPSQALALASTPEEQKLKDDLLAISLQEEQVQELMRRYDPLRIRRQLAWLPYRQAKNQAGYLIAAIKDNYAAPRALTIPTEESEHDGRI